MDQVAFVFAGQGAQYPGMGRELYEASPAAQGVMDRAEAARPGTKAQCFGASPQELALTVNTQPCLFTVDLMCAAALGEQGVAPALCAGFSLGEVAAAAFTGMLDFPAAFAFVQERSGAMHACAQAAPGFMAAVLRLAPERVKALCGGLEAVYPVNFNGPGQVVVSGALAQKDAFLQAVAEQGGRAVPLAVSGAFHSPFMAEAAQHLLQWLGEAGVKPPALPLYANSTARPYEGDCAALLARQVDHPVLWEDTVRHMARAGAQTFVELGPGTVLSGLIRKILPQAKVLHVQDQASLAQTVKVLKGGGGLMQGRVALVTGGSRGIGRAVALRLAREGARVAILYGGNEQAAHQTLEELLALGGQALALRCDVGSLPAVEAAFGRIKEALGPVDILVNNAGITQDALTPRMSQEAFDKVVQVNLSGAFYLIRTAYGDLMRRRWGRIVNISSVSGLMGNPGQANYAAAKAGLIGLTKTIAKELASRNVTCNAVAPGFIETDMTQALGQGLLEKATAGIPVGRMGTAREVAAAVAFLCGEEAAYITGAVLQVDGGLYM